MNGETEKNEKLYDLVIKAGHVIDPGSGIDRRMDVAVTGGKIALLAPDIPASEAKQTVDAAGLFVTPGILDIHTHVYQYRVTGPGGLEAVHADAHLLASGVTTTVDVGTVGWKNFSDFKQFTIDRSKVRILALLNIAANGMADTISEQTMADMQPELAAEVVKAYPEWLVGIKTAHY